jgi:probable F420-dependent oxidoreductase
MGMYWLASLRSPFLQALDHAADSTLARVRVKFGLNIINFGPEASPESLHASVEWAEAVGFQIAMVSDHVAVTPEVARRYPAPFYEPFTTLAWLAGRTSTIELGTTVVILPYRHPLLTARMSSNLDQLCGGRLVLGIGVGWARTEFEALGAPFQRRGRVTDDYLGALHAHWAEDIASVQTGSVAFRDIHTQPAPVRRPHPPVWVGGSSTAAIRRAAGFGDAWHPLNASLEWLERGLTLLREEAERKQRPTPAFVPRIKVRLTDTRLDDVDRRPGQGNLDQIRRDLAHLATLGASYVVLDTYHGDPAELAEPASAQRTLDALLAHAIDLIKQTLR